MKTRFSILAYVIGFVTVLTLVYMWNKEYVLPVALSVGGAMLVTQVFKMVFRDRIQKDKFKQNVSQSFDQIPDYSDDSGDSGDNTVAVANGHGENDESDSDEHGRPDEDGY